MALKITHLFPHSSKYAQEQRTICSLLELDNYEILLNLPLICADKKIVLPLDLKTSIFPEFYVDSACAICYENLDAVLISDAWGFAALPFFRRIPGCSDIPVYATEDAIEIGRILVDEFVTECLYASSDFGLKEDFLSINEISLSSIYSKFEFTTAMESVTSVQLGQVISVCDVLKVSPKRSGLTLESTNWLLKYFDYSILLLNDLSNLESRSVVPLDSSFFYQANTVVVLQHSNGFTNAEYENCLQKINNEIGNVVSSGEKDGFKQSVLLVCNQLELMLDLFFAVKKKFEKTPIHIFGTCFQKLLLMLQKYPECVKFTVNDLKLLFNASDNSFEEMKRLKEDMNSRPCILLYFKLTPLNSDLYETKFIKKSKFPVNLIVNTVSNLNGRLKRFFRCPIVDLYVTPKLKISALKDFLKKQTRQILLSESLVSEVPSCVSGLKIAEIDMISDTSSVSSSREVFIYSVHFIGDEINNVINPTVVELPNLHYYMQMEIEESSGKVFLERVNKNELPVISTVTASKSKLLNGQEDILKLESSVSALNRVVANDELLEHVTKILHENGIEFTASQMKPLCKIELKPPFQGTSIVQENGLWALKSSNYMAASKLQRLLE